MRNIYLTAALIASLPTAAMATNWFYRSEAWAEGERYYIDEDSIRVMPNGNKRAWLEYTRAYELWQSGAPTEIKSLIEYDCPEGRLRILQRDYYEVGWLTETKSGPSEWFYVPPNSLEEKHFDYVCFGKPPE